VTILLGNGDGTFRSTGSYPVNGLVPGCMRVADLTGNGRLDLVTTNTGSANVSVLMGNGDGTFQPAKTYPVGLAPQCLTIGDLNGDGKPDVVAGSAASNVVSVLLNNGDGTFGVGPDQPQPFYRSHRTSVTSPGVVRSTSRSARSALPGWRCGEAMGRNLRPAHHLPGGARSWWVTADDLLNNGKVDLVVANGLSGSLSVLLGNGDGTFQPAVTY